MKDKSSKRIKFWYGNDDFSMAALLKSNKREFLDKNKNAEIASYDFSNKEKRLELEKKLANTLRDVSLFSSEKIIIIKDFFSSKRKVKSDKGEEDDLVDLNDKSGDFESFLLENLSNNSSNWIFILESKEMDKRSKSYKIFEKFLKEGLLEKKDFFIPLNFEFNAWLEKSIKERGGKISKENVNLLAMLLGKDMELREKGSVTTAYDLFQSSMEIDKLISYCNGAEISKEDIMLLVASSADMNIFSLISSIGDRNKKKSIEILSKQIERGFNENYILTMMIYHFRGIISVKSLLDRGMNVDDIVRTTRMHPVVVQKNIKYCQKMDDKYILTVYDKLYSADINIKKGNMSPELALNILIAAI